MAKGTSRDKRREARWRRMIREHGRSGLTIRDFCRKSNLHESAFYFWRGELQRRGLVRRQAEQEQRRQRTRSAQAPSTASTPAFVEVRLEGHSSTPAGGRIEIELSGGRRIHVTAPVDRQALADVLSVLERRPC